MPYKEDALGFRVTGKGASIKRLWGLQNEICRLHVLGLKGTHIAEMMGVTPQTVYNIVGSEKGKEVIDRLSLGRDVGAEDIQKRIQEIQPLALEILTDAMIDDEAKLEVRVGIAQDMMNRGGHKPVSKVDVKSIHYRVDADFLKEIKDRADEIGEEIEEVKVLSEERKTGTG